MRRHPFYHLVFAAVPMGFFALLAVLTCAGRKVESLNHRAVSAAVLALCLRRCAYAAVSTPRLRRVYAAPTPCLRRAYCAVPAPRRAYTPPPLSPSIAAIVPRIVKLAACRQHRSCTIDHD